MSENTAAEPEVIDASADTSSLADYEASVHLPAVNGSDPHPSEADDEDPPSSGTESVADRGADGKFKPRHRAASQQAGAEDVEQIAAHTKRLRAAEAEFTDIVKQDGESERAFNIRKRAEIAERAKAAKAPPSAPPISRAGPARVEPTRAVTVPPKPLASDVGTKYPTYEDYIEAVSNWTTDRRYEAREQERVKQKMQADAHAEGQRIQAAFVKKTEAAKAKYKDFQAVALDAPTRIPSGSIPDLFILEHKAGADVLYHLQQHGDELDALLTKPALEQVDALSLLAQRLTTPAAADLTGAAPRQTSQPAPKPPTPVRGGPSRPADELPTADDTPLSEHEKAFHTPRRR